MTLQPTLNACFPRSGHHILRAVLAAYFGPDFHFGDGHNDPASRLLVCPSTNYEKNHDFNLDVPVRPDWRYVVQVRNPLDAIVSWHALNVRSVGETDAGPLDLWCRDRLHYWCGFVQKWLYSPVPHRLVVNYEDLLARPAEVVTNVVQFMCGTVTIDYDRVRQVLRDVPITPRSSGNRYCYARA